MTHLEAFQIVGITLWYVLGAVSPILGNIILLRMKEGEDMNLLICSTVAFWTYGWTLYWIIQGWPKIGGGQ